LTADGHAYCWGQDFAGALGDGTYGTACGGKGSDCSASPVAVVGNHIFSQIAVGGSHTCGITTDSHAWCWGDNRYGQLGSPQVPCAGYIGGDSASGKYLCSPVPVEVQGGRLFRSIAAASSSTCGVTTDGVAYCWGGNLNAVLGVPGIGELNTVNATPLAVATDQRFTSIYLGVQTGCAIDVTASAWCWGSDFAGQLGNGGNGASKCLNGPCEPSPVKVLGGLSWKTLTIGGSSTCGLTTDNVVYCWGSGYTGALGTGLTGNSNIPSKVAFQK
jgi:alpha-tubulin suppressor-like RCC1 family protein